MKNIFLITLVLSCLFSFGKCNKHCKKKSPATTETTNTSNEVWMRYDETKCANPWNFNWFAAPTDEQLAGAVKGNLEEKSIHVLEIKTTRDKDAVTCDACTCPNGFHYFVRVNKTDAAKLKDMKFVEVSKSNKRFMSSRFAVTNHCI